MSTLLVGTYFNQTTGETLVINSADPESGQLSGTLMIAVVTSPLPSPMSGVFSSVTVPGAGPSIYLAIMGQASYPDERGPGAVCESWAGFANIGASGEPPDKLTMSGVRGFYNPANTENQITLLSGTFVRQ